ncbi:hypothetical protein DSO57_1020804 [Entomophthora muscae]|uniref:Uncharacterized protein n=1 Tax=Entomophthora muscae TaxID=34485 RepID=A0ACC2T3P4_9FUNG|nr:hypothetical protein DSO57_1020804 [Entomophthora muscae]
MYKIFVHNLSWSTTEELLRSSFAKFGQVTLVRDRDTGRSRGFGFVTFDTNEAAQKAVDAMHCSEFEGRRIEVTFGDYHPPSKATPLANGGYGYSGGMSYKQ